MHLMLSSRRRRSDGFRLVLVANRRSRGCGRTLAGPGGDGQQGRSTQPAADRRRRPRRGDARDRGRPAAGDAEPGRPGTTGRLLRAGVLQFAALHAEPAVADHGEAPACRRGDAAHDPALRRRAHDGRVVPRPGLPDGGDRQDALQRAVDARVRGAARHAGLAGASPGASAPGRRSPAALAAVPGPGRGLAQRRLPPEPDYRPNRCSRPISSTARSSISSGSGPAIARSPWSSASTTRTALSTSRMMGPAIPARGFPGPADLGPRPPGAARGLRLADARRGPRHPGGLLHVALVRGRAGRPAGPGPRRPRSSRTGRWSSTSATTGTCSASTGGSRSIASTSRPSGSR